MSAGQEGQPKEAEGVSPRKLKGKCLKEFLSQWHAENPHLLDGARLTDAAERLEEICNGHSGLTGVCAQRLDFEATAAQEDGQEYTIEEFENFLAWTVPAQLSLLPVYQKLIMGILQLTRSQHDLLSKVKLSILHLPLSQAYQKV